MKRVTDFREVEYIVPDGTPLPDEVKDYLSLCIGKRVSNARTGQHGTKYVIPIYLMQEWLAKYAQEVSLLEVEVGG